MKENLAFYFTVKQSQNLSNIWKAQLNPRTLTIQRESAKKITHAHQVHQFINNNPSVIQSQGLTKILFYSNRQNQELVEMNNQIYCLSAEKGEERIEQLTFGEQNNYDPIFGWSKDQVFYKSNRLNGLGNIWQMRSEVSMKENHECITKNMEGKQWKPQICRQNQLVFTNNTNSQAQIWKIVLQKQNLQKLTENNVPDWYPTYNSKRNQVIFISRNQGSLKDSIFRINSQGKDRKELTKMQGDSGDPFYIRDQWSGELGDKIMFINNRSGKYQMYIMGPEGNDIMPIECQQFNDLNILSPVVCRIYSVE